MKNYILIAVLAIGLASCSENKPSTTVTINHTEDKTLVITHVKQQLHDTIQTVANQAVTYNLDISAPTVIRINDGRRGYDCYITPGEQLVVKNDPEARNAIKVQSEAGTESELYSRFTESMIKARSAVNVFKAPDFASLQDSLDKKYMAASNLISELKDNAGVSAAFKSLLADRLQFSKGSDMENFPSYNEHYLKKKPVLADDFYDFRKTIDRNSDNILLTAEGRNYAGNYISQNSETDDPDDASAYFSKAVEVAGSAFTNPTNRAFFKAEQISDVVSFNGGLENGNEALVMSAMKETDNAYLQSKYKNLIAEWSHLKSGSEAPDFDGKNRQDEQVKLSDLKGKYVYVDVWATWCGPCIREIPDLKKVEKAYHDKEIEFVSISIDKQEDKEKWIKMVGQKELKGTQIMADNAWDSGVVTEYNIAGIPRFILIDKEGNLVKADAPNPSNPDLIDLFESLDM